MNLRLIRSSSLAACLLTTATTSAQLAVKVSPAKAAGEKITVELVMRNDFDERIDSARAVCFLTDEQGKMVGQSTRWVIDGSKGKPGLAAGATNSYYFVVQSGKPIATTHLTAKVTFNRVVLEGGKLADASKDVKIEQVGQ